MSLSDPIFEICDFQFTYSAGPVKQRTALNPAPFILDNFYNCFIKFFIKITRLPETRNIWIYCAHIEFQIMKECRNFFGIAFM